MLGPPITSDIQYLQITSTFYRECPYGENSLGLYSGLIGSDPGLVTSRPDREISVVLLVRTKRLL
jgi:hypothetical protein